MTLTLNQVNVYLPGLVEITEHTHGVETVKEVDDHENEDNDPNALASFVLVLVKEIRCWFIAEVHEEGDDCGETQTGEKTCVACQVQRKTGAIPVIEAAELLDQVAEGNLTERNHEEYDGEIKEKVALFRCTDQEVHPDDGDAITEKKWKVHVTVIDKTAPGEHPEVFNNETEERYECGHCKNFRYIVKLRL